MEDEQWPFFLINDDINKKGGLFEDETLQNVGELLLPFSPHFSFSTSPHNETDNPSLVDPPLPVSSQLIPQASSSRKRKQPDDTNSNEPPPPKILGFDLTRPKFHYMRCFDFRYRPKNASKQPKRSTEEKAYTTLKLRYPEANGQPVILTHSYCNPSFIPGFKGHYIKVGIPDAFISLKHTQGGGFIVISPTNGAYEFEVAVAPLNDTKLPPTVPLFIETAVSLLTVPLNCGAFRSKICPLQLNVRGEASGAHPQYSIQPADNQ